MVDNGGDYELYEELTRYGTCMKKKKVQNEKRIPFLWKIFFFFLSESLRDKMALVGDNECRSVGMDK